jgi:hypothetical protein
MAKGRGQDLAHKLVEKAVEAWRKGKKVDAEEGHRYRTKTTYSRPFILEEHAR